MAGYIASALVLAPSVAAIAGDFSIEQCDNLLKLNEHQFLCPYSDAHQQDKAKLFEGGKLSDAPDGKYKTHLGDSLYRDYQVTYVMDHGRRWTLDAEAPLANNEGALRFYLDTSGGQIVYLCKVAQPCVQAPNGTYTTAHQLPITVNDGHIDIPDSTGLSCIYGTAYDHDIDRQRYNSISPDKKEFIGCEDVN